LQKKQQNPEGFSSKDFYSKVILLPLANDELYQIARMARRELTEAAFLIENAIFINHLL
jgi:hypothetical protein